MSDRIATECGDLRQQIEPLFNKADDSEIRQALLDAADKLKLAEERDRELHGHTPEDALAAHVKNTDECPNCGKEIDEGGWCSFSCMQEDLGEGEE